MCAQRSPVAWPIRSQCGPRDATVHVQCCDGVVTRRFVEGSCLSVPSDEALHAGFSTIFQTGATDDDHDSSVRCLGWPWIVLTMESHVVLRDVTQIIRLIFTIYLLVCHIRVFIRGLRRTPNSTENNMVIVQQRRR